MKSNIKGFVAVVSPLVFSGLLLMAIPATAIAGIEPSPFKPEINQLGAAVNILNSADNRILKVMATPPDDTEPGPGLEGAVNRLAAINNQLYSVEDMINSLVTEVMGTEPSPFRVDVIPALQEVVAAGTRITTNIEQIMGVEPCPFLTGAVIEGTEPSPFIDALVGVQCAAQSIVDTTANHIRAITAGMDCSAIVNPELCVFPCLGIPSNVPTHAGPCGYDPAVEQ